MNSEKPIDWFVLYVAPHREFAVQSELCAAGHNTFVPVLQTLKRVSRHAKRKELVQFPLFAQYVFVQFGPHLNVKAFPDIHYAVSFGAGLARISDAAIQECRSQPVRVDAERALKPGDRAEVTTGVLIGQFVQVVSLERRRAKAVLFGHQKIMNLPLDALQAA